MAQTSPLTKTQQRILSVLSDGEMHSLKELHQQLDDELASVNAVTWHLVQIRKVIKPAGRMILCQFHNRRLFYRLVQHVAPSSSSQE
jgi:hypothetical protein